MVGNVFKIFTNRLQEYKNRCYFYYCCYYYAHQIFFFVLTPEELINRIIALTKEQGDAIDDKVGDETK